MFLAKKPIYLFKEAKSYKIHKQNLTWVFWLQEIRVIVKEIEKNARDILIILQNIHNVVISKDQEHVGMFLVKYFLSVYNFNFYYTTNIR